MYLCMDDDDCDNIFQMWILLLNHILCWRPLLKSVLNFFLFNATYYRLLQNNIYKNEEKNQEKETSQMTKLFLQFMKRNIFFTFLISIWLLDTINNQSCISIQQEIVHLRDCIKHSCILSTLNALFNTNTITHTHIIHKINKTLYRDIETISERQQMYVGHDI